MTIDIITKNDILSLEEKINLIAESLKSNEIKGLGKVYDTKELAVKLRVSTKTINNWRDARIIEFIKIQNTILYTERTVSDFMASHTIKRKNTIAMRIKALNEGQ